MGWVFINCRSVRAPAAWSDKFAGMMSLFKKIVPKLRVSKHHNKSKVKRDYARRKH